MTTTLEEMVNEVEQEINNEKEMRRRARNKRKARQRKMKKG